MNRPNDPATTSPNSGDVPDTGAEVSAPDAAASVAGRLHLTEAAWRAQLSPIEYEVTRNKATERPFTGRYWNHDERGVYRCIGCATPLFASDTKFDAGCGWPSYFAAVDAARITELRDTAHGMIRTEILCAKCDAHLGHVFDDGPEPTGLRYCVNSASLKFEKT